MPSSCDRGEMRAGGGRLASAVAPGFATLLLLAMTAFAPARGLAQSCAINENCSGNLNVGMCGYADAVCVPPPGGSGSCASGGKGSCSGTYNCQPPIAAQQGVQLLSAGGGSFTARLSVDVVAPFNSWATEHSPPGTLNVFWYNSPSVPDICDGSVQSSLCTLANAQSVNGHLGTDHGLTWLDETGLTCAGAPYDFMVSALFSTCQQPSCACEQQFGDPNCICHATVSTPLNGLEIKLPKAAFPGCVPPPEFCPEAGGAGGGSGGGGAGSPGAPGEKMGAAGSKGTGPDSGAAGTQGNGQCQSCKALGSSSGDGSGCGASVGGGGASCLFKASGAHFRYGAGGVGGPGWPGSTGVTVNPWNTTLGRYWSHDYAERIVMDPDETHVWLLTRFGSFREFGGLAAGSDCGSTRR